MNILNDWELETKRQKEWFEQYLQETEGTHNELEWLTFMWGWNAAKKEFGVKDE